MALCVSSDDGVCIYCLRPLPTKQAFRMCAEAPETQETKCAGKNVSAGPGTQLSRLLRKFGINPTPTCQCRAKAAEMDAWGPDECEKPERIEEVLGVMREEAKARGLPFLDAAGRMLIRRAIRNARKAAS